MSSAEDMLEESSAQSRRMDQLEAENERLSRLLGLVESSRPALGTAPSWSTKRREPGKATATACMQLSDLHLDEVVDPAEVGGLNAYNRDVAELRLRRFADKACEMGERHKHDWEGAVVFWGGDMVSGSIHEELRETNAATLPETMLHWAPRLAAALAQIADVYGHVHVPGVVGNHGRLTQKMQAKRRGKASWDYLLFGMVKRILEADKRLSFEEAPGSYLMVPLYGRHVFLTHGDEVKGGGGWAGIWSPLGTMYRRALELGTAHGLKIDHVASGHWHTTVLAHARGLVCNGSLKGYDEFASGLRLKPEAAMQNWWVATPEHGVTLAGALMLEDRKREGW